MRIHSVQLTNFRKFVGSHTVDGIGDGLNVLVGRNELGKSTLLHAINGVIFEKARSLSQHVKSFRHHVNGTVPEVKLAFEVEGKNWTIQKRFAGQAGKAVLTCSDSRVFEDEAAESELQHLLGFTGGRGGGEPGIWGTLWVQQGHSFGDPQLDEQARRTMQGCLEAQVGVVTGGSRGHRIPKAVREALEELRSARGPRGKFKETIDELGELRTRIAELETKRAQVFSLMEDLARAKREQKELQTGWDDDANREELEAERSKRSAAATQAAEIETAKIAAGIAQERAQRARQLVEERALLAAEVGRIESQVQLLETALASQLLAKGEAQESVEAGEAKLAELRQQSSNNGARGRELGRIREAVLLGEEVHLHEMTLAKASELEEEVGRLTEEIGAIAATDEMVASIEEAVTELSAAEAATSAVATTVSFALEESARSRVRLDGERLGDATASVPLLAKSVITIEEIGTIVVEPQIKNRGALLKRRDVAQEALKVALEAAGVDQLSAARAALAKRKEHQRRLKDVQGAIASLAPGSRVPKLSPGFDALRARVGELRGQLKTATQKLNLAGIPSGVVVEDEIRRNHAEGALLAEDLAAAEAALAGPRDLFNQASKSFQKEQEKLAERKGTLASKTADLEVARGISTDAQLATAAGDLQRASTEKADLFADLQRKQGESLEAVDARIKRLERSAVNHQKAVADLNVEVIRLTTLIQANEGDGVVGVLASAEVERDRLTAMVADYEQEVAVLELLLQTLETAEREAKNRYLAPVVRRVEPYLRMLIPGANIVLDEELHITAMERDGVPEDFEILSGGTQEQLAVLTRIAFAELLLLQGRPATVILDDACAFSDDDRIESMFDVLMRAGEQVQIIVLTCRRKLFSRLGASPLQIRDDRLVP